MCKYMSGYVPIKLYLQKQAVGWIGLKAIDCQPSSKESACNAADAGSIPGSGRSSGGGNGNPGWHLCLENPMQRGAWCTTVQSRKESDSFLKLARNFWEPLESSQWAAAQLIYTKFWKLPPASLSSSCLPSLLRVPPLPHWQNLKPQGRRFWEMSKWQPISPVAFLSPWTKIPPLLTAHSPLCSPLSVLQTCWSLFLLRTFARATPFAWDALSTLFPLFYL